MDAPTHHFQPPRRETQTKAASRKEGKPFTSCSSHQLPQFHFSIHDSLPFPHLFLRYHHLIKKFQAPTPPFQSAKGDSFLFLFIGIISCFFLSSPQTKNLFTGYSRVISFRSVPFFRPIGDEGRVVCVFLLQALSWAS